MTARQPFLKPAGGVLRAKLSAPTGVHTLVAFKEQGVLRVASASRNNDYAILLWDVAAGGEPLLALKGHTNHINSLCIYYVSGKAQIVSGSDDRRVLVWSSMSGHPCAVLRGHTDYVTSVAAFQDNSNDFIISSSWDREVRIWDAEKALVLNIITFHPRPVNALCTYFDEKGKRRMVISGSDDSNCRVFDPFYGGSEPAGILRGHTAPVKQVVCFQDTTLRKALTASSDRTLRLWVLSYGPCWECETILTGHSMPVYDVTQFFFNGNSYAVSAGRDRDLRGSRRDCGAGRRQYL